MQGGDGITVDCSEVPLPSSVLLNVVSGELMRGVSHQVQRYCLRPEELGNLVRLALEHQTSKYHFEGHTIGVCRLIEYLEFFHQNRFFPVSLNY